MLTDSDVEIVGHLSADELAYVAKWMSEAFQHDYFWRMMCNCDYADNPRLWETHTRGVLQRALQCGYLLITKDRNACRTIFEPGHVNRTYDLSWRTDCDENWDEAARQIGLDNLERACTAIFSRVNAVLDELYNNRGNDDMFRSQLLGVNPKVHGQGYGTVLMRHTLKEIRKTGAKWWFITGSQNLPYYESFGCRSKGIFQPPGRPEDFPNSDPGSFVLHVVEVE